uniref:Membrane spanning 4-domains A8 n=1 Tax=Anolis carolinensis TaxID=28377 RepID=A0A803T3A4_ANOCA|nr:PREDICTED: membrane-spanning 4-domains subfamily A member 8 isoform X1 [Anolis carolinensis]XP_008114041.1 PREDICTED: membrane-spanning 4-domains subfamily A member 8 isoform X1 [Anolis carolinensis]XP_008114042.1 PREDICTED: membrane-spanning 4-domains subfamily A member 8 isoform X1 [Anolis carolinensis]XP_008114043.1 PREDICTED: membrane-spanning 4-domains subfamily A member 8 isoform X1 [Anolis carolinensis]|eukprot:XP_008114040.1 PREDICTED: membrane-spanning 4-domains subfamily A member 8 isoform X1 [Anolis carolinensis]
MTLGRVVFLPPNGDNKIQQSQGMPATLIQPQGRVQYVHYNSQQPWSPNTSLQKFLKVETKILGAIQIIIGIIHIGFGAIPVYLFSPIYQPLSGAGGYHFWGGLFFIFSGSLSIAVEKRLNPCLVKFNVGMNIASAIVALVGIILCIYELHSNQHSYETYKRNFNDDNTIDPWSVGAGLCSLFLLFTLLELFVAVFTVYFGCKAVSCNSNDTDTIVLPCTVIGNEMNPNEDSLNLPACEHGAYSPA